jgi:hypothetical protein
MWEMVQWFTGCWVANTSFSPTLLRNTEQGGEGAGDRTGTKEGVTTGQETRKGGDRTATSQAQEEIRQEGGGRQGRGDKGGEETAQEQSGVGDRTGVGCGKGEDGAGQEQGKKGDRTGERRGGQRKERDRTGTNKGLERGKWAQRRGGDGTGTKEVRRQDIIDWGSRQDHGEATGQEKRWWVDRTGTEEVRRHYKSREKKWKNRKEQIREDKK